MVEMLQRRRRLPEHEERKLAVSLIEAMGTAGSVAAAARALHIGKRRARRLLARYGVTMRRGWQRRLPQSVDIAEFAKDLTTAQAGQLLEVSHQAVARALRDAGVKRRRGRPPTIDPEEVKEMRTCGYSYRDIADVLGVSYEGVRRAYHDGRSVVRRLDAADVVRLRDEHHFTWEQVGQHLTCHPDTAKKLYYKAKRAAAEAPRAPDDAAG